MYTQKLIIYNILIGDKNFYIKQLTKLKTYSQYDVSFIEQISCFLLKIERKKTHTHRHT